MLTIERMTKAKPMKVPVTERALMQRVNRKLAKEDQMIRKSRPFYDHGSRTPIFDQNTGEFFRINTARNWLVEGHVDLEVLARELGVLAAWEELRGE
jgi:hypothetical protein